MPARPEGAGGLRSEGSHALRGGAKTSRAAAGPLGCVPGLQGGQEGLGLGPAADFDRLLALWGVLQLVVDFVALFEGLEAFCLDLREVGEHVGAGVIGGDEAEAFCVVEPLYCSSCHDINALR